MAQHSAKEGYLRKKGGTLGNWSSRSDPPTTLHGTGAVTYSRLAASPRILSRYFVLFHNKFQYFVDRHKAMTGEFNIYSSTTVIKHHTTAPRRHQILQSQSLRITTPVGGGGQRSEGIHPHRQPIAARPQGQDVRPSFFPHNILSPSSQHQLVPPSTRPDGCLLPGTSCVRGTRRTWISGSRPFRSCRMHVPLFGRFHILFQCNILTLKLSHSGSAPAGANVALPHPPAELTVTCMLRAWDDQSL
jgi:hypothetical protein